MVRRRVRTLFLLVVVATCLILSACPLYYSLLMAAFGWNDLLMGDVVLALTLRDVSEPLVYHQPHMAGAPTGAAEYSYGLQIDTDDDAATGDAEGFDVTLSVSLETGGDTTGIGPLTGTFADLLPAMNVEPLVDTNQDRIAGAADNTLYIGAASDDYIWNTWDDVFVPAVQPSPTFRARFFARFNNPPDPGTEIVDTVELIGNGTQTDPAEDVPYGFIDIIEVRIENLPTEAAP